MRFTFTTLVAWASFCSQTVLHALQIAALLFIFSVHATINSILVLDGLHQLRINIAPAWCSHGPRTYVATKGSYETLGVERPIRPLNLRWRLMGAIIASGIIAFGFGAALDLPCGAALATEGFPLG